MRIVHASFSALITESETAYLPLKNTNTDAGVHVIDHESCIRQPNPLRI
jgi:hypothetical protein